MKKPQLRLIGIPSHKAANAYREVLGFEEGSDKLELIVFCDFSSEEIQVGHVFNRVTDPLNQLFIEGQIVLKKVTQEFGILYDSIPIGHKSLCMFQIGNDKVYKFLKQLPLVSSWHDVPSSFIID